MLSLRAHFAFPTLVLAAGLCLAACSTKENKTALLVNVTLDSSAIAPDTVTIDTVVVVVNGGSAKFTGQFPWSDAKAGLLSATLLLPAEAAGKEDTLDVQGTLGGSEMAVAPSQTITIVAGKATGPIAVVLKPSVILRDGGIDALPGDGPPPDLSAGSEVGIPDAGVTPDTRIDEPRPEAAAPDAPLPSDVAQPVEVGQSPDAPQPSYMTDAGADAPHPTEAGADAPPPTDSVEAGADTGADSSAAPAWQPVENAQNDPNDPLGSSTDSVGAIAVAVDPVRDHVYAMWADNSTWAVRVRRWNHTTATWESTRTLVDSGAGYPEDLQIGVDGAGHVIAAWRYDFISTASDTTVTQMGGVWVSQSADGDTWSAAAAVTPQRPRYVAELCLAVARNGQARIAFSEKLTASPYTVLPYSAYFDGTTWTTGSSPFAAEDPNDQNDHYPSMAIADDGSGIILFTQPDSGGNDSVAASTFAGSTVDDFVILDSNITDDLSEMAVAVNRSGQGVVVWGDTNGPMLRSYSPSTKAWTAARSIGNADLYQPRAVMAQDGTATVAWSQWVSGFYNVWTMEGTASGTWTVPMALEQGNLSIPNSPYANYFTEALPFPALAVDGAGNVLVLWSRKTQDTPTHEFAVEARRKLAGTPNNWQPTTELARKSILLPVSPSLAVSDDGLGAASYYWGNPDSSTSVPDEEQVFVSLFR
ncbi:MAG: hypothetical protein WCG85_12850 [Polyangia bacterium]